MRCATQPSTFLGTSWKKSRTELCFLWGKKKKRERKNPSHRLRPCKQQQGASDSEVGQQSDPSHILDATRHAMETMWIIFLTQLPSSIGLLSHASFPFLSLKHLFPDREKAELPHDSPNPGCIISLSRRIWALSITQNVS